MPFIKDEGIGRQFKSAPGLYNSGVYRKDGALCKYYFSYLAAAVAAAGKHWAGWLKTHGLARIIERDRKWK